MEVEMKTLSEIEEGFKERKQELEVQKPENLVPNEVNVILYRFAKKKLSAVEQVLVVKKVLGKVLLNAVYKGEDVRLFNQRMGEFVKERDKALHQSKMDEYHFWAGLHTKQHKAFWND